MGTKWHSLPFSDVLEEDAQSGRCISTATLPCNAATGFEIPKIHLQATPRAKEDMRLITKALAALRFPSHSDASSLTGARIDVTNTCSKSLPPFSGTTSRRTA